MVSVAGPGQDDGPGGHALMRDLLVALPAAVAYVSGPDMIFEFANEEYRRTVGMRDLIGRPFREALPEVVGQPQFEDLREVLRTGTPRRGRGEELWVHRGGPEPERLHVDSACQPVLDEAGRVAGVLIFFADVSAHVRDRQRPAGLTRGGELSWMLFETLPQGVVFYGADGSVRGANPAARAILGADLAPPAAWPPAHATGIVAEDGSPLSPEELPTARTMRTGQASTDVVFGFRRPDTSELRWVRTTSIPYHRDEAGVPGGAYTVYTDITAQRRTEAALRESNHLLGRMREANVLGVVVTRDERIEEANDAFLDIIGYTREELDSGRLTWDSITPPGWADADEKAIEQLRATGACPPYEQELLHRDVHRVPVLVGSVLLDSRQRLAKFVVDLSARQRSDRERAELRERTASAETAAARERLGLLLGAGDLVAATTSRRELLDQIAQLVVPALSDHCVIYLPTGQGMLRAASVADRDPERTAILDGLRQIDLPPAGPLLPQLAFTKAATRLVADVSIALAGLSSPEPGVSRAMAILQRVSFRSGIATPLLIGRRPVGVLVLGRYQDRPGFTEADMPVITELARRLAAGLANVETFAREHTVAETLQHALLPEAPPRIGGLDLAVRYLPATDGVHVGGDWYDAFPVGRKQIGLVIGDAAGHSIDSASVMGQIRSILRTCALDHPSPPAVLRRVNVAMSRLLPDALATVFYGVLDLPTGEFSYANAGHPPPLVAENDGDIEYLGTTPGVILGAVADATYPMGSKQLQPGARLLLYTDGLIEDRKRDLSEGLNILARVLRQPGQLNAEQTCQSVQEALLGTSARADDVCVLAVRRLHPAPGMASLGEVEHQDRR